MDRIYEKAKRTWDDALETLWKGGLRKGPASRYLGLFHHLKSDDSLSKEEFIENVNYATHQLYSRLGPDYDSDVHMEAPEEKLALYWTVALLAIKISSRQAWTLLGILASLHYPVGIPHGLLTPDDASIAVGHLGFLQIKDQ